MKPNRTFLAVLAFVLVAGVGCKKEYLSTGPDFSNQQISYATQINPIWQASCTGSGCHGAGGIPPVLTTDKSYAQLYSGGYIDSTNTVPTTVQLWKNLNALDGATPMPATKLNNESLNLIETWIKQGSKNN